MNPLIDGYPETIEIGGREYAIRTDHRVGMMISLAANDPAIADIERAGIMINLLYIDRPQDDLAAWDGLLAYMRAGAEPTTEKDAGPRALDFDVDWMHILAAFRQAYGIDLNTHTLHYWEFTALLGGLPEECSLAKIIGYRTMTIDADLTGKQKAFYRKMRDKHALPILDKNRAQKDVASAIGAAIRGNVKRGGR